jgi:hypothetical protein
VLVGLAVSVAVATLLLLLARAASVPLPVDHLAAVVLSEGGVARSALAVVLLVVAAPLLEELVFRGVVVTALAQRRRRTAVVVSAAAFAAAHLEGRRLVPLFVLGLVLGFVYLRRGLAASVTAHGAHNAVALALAVASITGSARVMSGNEVTLRLPPRWTSTALIGREVFAAIGPSTARLGILHELVPEGMRVLSAAERRRKVAGEPALGGLRLDAASVQTGRLPAGADVRARGTVRGHRVEVVMILGERDVWTVALVTAGSHRAERDFDYMLPTLRLPVRARSEPSASEVPTQAAPETTTSILAAALPPATMPKVGAVMRSRAAPTTLPTAPPPMYPQYLTPMPPPQSDSTPMQPPSTTTTTRSHPISLP